jgi:hypothetical protein
MVGLFVEVQAVASFREWKQPSHLEAELLVSPWMALPWLIATERQWTAIALLKPLTSWPSTGIFAQRTGTSAQKPEMSAMALLTLKQPRTAQARVGIVGEQLLTGAKPKPIGMRPTLIAICRRCIERAWFTTS